MASIPTHAGGLAWVCSYDREHDWTSAVAELPGSARARVFGNGPPERPGEWMGTVTLANGSHANYGHAPGSVTLRKALGHFGPLMSPASA